MSKLGLAVLFAGAVAVVTPSFAAVKNTYFVGNSLTQNIVANSVGGGYEGRLQRMAAGYGDTLSAGYHIVGGAGLADITSRWDANHTADIASPSGYGVALTGSTWDQIVVEPWRHSVNSEISSMASILAKQPAGAKTPVYLYQTWPAKTLPSGAFDASGTLDYLATWNASYPSDSTEVAYRQSSGYYSRLLTRARETFSDRPVYMIPVGEVMAEIQRRIDSGTFTGLTNVTQLYGDGVHQNYFGEYLDCLVMDAVLFKKDVRELSMQQIDVGYMSESLDAQLRDAVGDVVFGNVAVTGVPEPVSAVVIASAAFALRRSRRN